MANNPRIIQPKAKDPGAAASIADISRRVRTLESQAGVVGVGAVITGPTIQTADANPRVYMQGPLGVNPGGTGIFITDSGGTADISIVPTTGITISGGGGMVINGGNGITVNGGNGIAIDGGSGLVLKVSGSVVATLSPTNGLILAPGRGVAQGVTWGNSNSIQVDTTYGYFHVNNAAQTHFAELELKGDTDGGFPAEVKANVDTFSATLLDGTGNSFFNGDVSANAFHTTSDERVKAEIRNASDDTSPLHKLRIIGFRSKVSGRKHIGFLAQDVRQHFPDFVIERAVRVNPEDPEGPSTLLAIDVVSLLAATVSETIKLRNEVNSLTYQSSQLGPSHE